MTYNELIDALLEVAIAATTVVENSRMAAGYDTVDPHVFTRMCDAIGTLEALPQKANSVKSGAMRAAEFIKDFRAARDARKAAEKSAMEWMCTNCHTVYPGPPQPGFACVVCPKCNGTTGPRLDIELRETKQREAELQEKLTEANLTLQAAGFKWQPRLGCWHAPTQHDMVVRAARAERALRAAGFEDRGGAEWVPPLGEPPRAHPLEHRVRDLETRLNGLVEWRQEAEGIIENMHKNLSELNHAAITDALTASADNHVHFHPAPKAPCSNCGAPAHKYSECPPFSVPPIPADVALQETPKRSLGAEVHNADKNDQVDPDLRQRMFDKLAWVKVGGDTASAKFLIKYVGGSDKLVDVPADKWQIMIDACDEYMRVRGGHA